MSSEAFVTAVVTKVTAKWVGDLLEASALKVRSRFRDSETRVALVAALRTAIEKSLTGLPVPPLFASFPDGGEFGDRLREMLSLEVVLGELCRLIDPRPEETPDLEAMLEAIAVESDLEHFAGFDLRLFLGSLGREFAVAAAGEAKLQGVLELRTLNTVAGEMTRVAGLGGRAAAAAERTAAAIERSADRLDQLAEVVRQALAGNSGELQPLLQSIINKSFAARIEAFSQVQDQLHSAGFGIEPGDGDLILRPTEGGVAPLWLSGLRQFVTVLLQSLEAAEPNEADLNQIEQRYRRHLLSWFENLTFQGMMRSPKPIVLPLEEVYVELRAVAEVPEGADTFSVEERRLLLELEARETGSAADGLRRELLAQLDALRRERWSRTLPDRQSMAEALHHPENRALVILGDPGSGKTTLLHYLALVFARGPQVAMEKLGLPAAEADRLPIFVPLAAYDDLRRRQPGLGLAEFLGRYYRDRRGLPGLARLFARALDRGRALVLFDGLDEVLDIGTRRFVADQVGALLTEWVPRGVRFVLSSRVVGYREAPLTVPVRTLTVLDFGASEIAIFSRRWSQAYERWLAGAESPETLRLAAKLERDLLTDVRENPGVGRLAANPLLLTMLALLRRQIGRLPHRRIELYESYVRTLLENWVELRNAGAREEKLERLESSAAEGLLMELALWLQREKPSGTASREELRRELVKVCLAEVGGAPSALQRREAEQRAERFLKEMRESTGLLVERGLDAFGFLHLTFQEFFAGRALAALDPKKRWRILEGRLHDPRWREPILLCAGRLGVVDKRREEVSSLVRAIWKAKDPTEADLHRNLKLALAIAGDDVYLEPALLQQLAAAMRRILPSGIETLDREGLALLAQMAANGNIDLEATFGPIWKSEDRQFERRATEALARFVDVEVVRDALLARMEASSDDGTILDGMHALIPVALSSPKVKAALLAKLDPLGSLRILAIGILGPLAAKDAEIRQALSRLLASKDHQARSAAVEALAPLAGEQAEIRDALLARLEDSEAPTPAVVIAALAMMAVSEGLMRARILDRFREWPWERLPISNKALSRYLDQPELRRILVSRLVSAPAEMAKRNLVLLLTPVVGESEVRDAFLALLPDEQNAARAAAITALAPLASDPTVRAALVRALAADDPYWLWQAIGALAGPAAAEPEIRAALLNLTRSPEFAVRRAAAAALARAADDPEVIEAQKRCLEDLDFEIGRVPAFEELDSRLRVDLLERLENHAPDVRVAAITALAFQAATDVDIRLALRAKQNDSSSRVRDVVWMALAEPAADAEPMRAELIDELRSGNPDLQEAAARACLKLAARWPDIRAALRTNLESRIDEKALLELYRLAPEDSSLFDLVFDRLGHSESAAYALAPRVAADPELRRRILDRLGSEPGPLRTNAARALKLSFQRDAAVREALVARAAEDPQVLFALGDCAAADSQFRVLLMDLAADPVARVRARSLHHLGSQAAVDGEVKSALLGALRDSSDEVRTSAIRALETALGDFEIRQALAEQLNDTDSEVRLAAVEALLPLAGEDPDLKNQLTALHLDEEFEVRKAVVIGLAPLAPNLLPSGLRETIFSWLQMDDRTGSLSSDRQALAAALAPRLAAEPELEEEIAAWLDSPRRSSRLGALAALLAWPGGAPVRFRPRMAALLDDRRDPRSFGLRLAAASALLNRNDCCREAIEVCLEALDYRQRPWENFLFEDGRIRQEAALLLGKLEPVHFDARVYDRLLEVLKSDDNPSVRDAAYGALLRLAQAREQAAAGRPGSDAPVDPPKRRKGRA